MRFLILNTDYPEFLGWLYAQNPGLENAPYDEQMQARLESLLGVADFYSSNLRKLGHEAWDIYANNEFMQKAWAREHEVLSWESAAVSPWWPEALQAAKHMGAKIPLSGLKSWVRPLLRFINSRPAWFYDILAAQIKHYKPDVLLNQDIEISTRFLREMKPCIGLLIGQHAATQPPDSEDWSCYDMVISSFPPMVEFFRQRGVRSELHRLCFEPKVLSHLTAGERIFEVTFVGSFHSVHSSRTALLEALCVQFPQLRIWGPGINSLSPNSSIRKCYMGQAWGREMYQILYRSKLVLNHHGDIGPYANNLRLYEATGVGCLLMTDWKKNLNEMFEPDREVAVYRNPQECAELIEYYLEHEEERAAIARAGQQRTLREHTYYHRVNELVDIVQKYLCRC